MFDFLASPVALVLRTIHAGLSTFLDPASGWAWGLSIVFLTMTVRLLLFPLFVKQIKSQRRMQEIAPKVKELQARHKGDRETLNTEMMKLYKDHGANPISGCLPLLLQLPVFFALFTVIREFKPDAEARFGLSAQLLEEGARAKILGAPVAAAFNSPSGFIAELDADITVVRIVAALMVVVMGATTFYTQKQMMARAGTVTDPQQVMVQKVLLYVLPLSFAVSGVFFPVGVLLYWMTTNIWSMGQQAWVIKRMPPVVPGATSKPDLTKGGAGKGGSAKVDLGKGAPSGSAGRVDLGATATTTVVDDRPASTRPVPVGRGSGSRKNKKKPRGGRR